MLKKTWKLYYIVKKKRILNETGATVSSCVFLPREINLISMLCLMFITIIGQHFQLSWFNNIVT